MYVLSYLYVTFVGDGSARIAHRIIRNNVGDVNMFMIFSTLECAGGRSSLRSLNFDMFDTHLQIALGLRTYLCQACIACCFVLVSVVKSVF